MYTFTIPRDEFDELRPDKQMIRKLIGKHISLVGRLKKNMNYYQGKHKILDDELESLVFESLDQSVLN